MPTTFTHFYYGQKVFDLLSPEIQGDLEAYMDYYNIGVHGPDILFYYHSYRHNPFNQYGVRVHHEKASVFFDRAMDVFREQRGQPEARAYLAGFMTHFILDSTCHPYINRRAKETGVSHTEIETDLDTVMMRDEGLIPFKVRRTAEIHPSLQKGRVIAPYYDKSPRQIYEGLVWHKLIVDHIFRSRFGMKRYTAGVISRILGPGQREGSALKVLQEHFTKSKINAKNTETISALQEMMSSSEDECAGMVTELMTALDQGDRGFVDHPRLQRNFS